MTRRLVATHLLFTIFVAGCNSHPSAPSPVAQRQRTNEPAPGEVPTPRSDPAHPLSGSYALTLTLGDTCGVLPSDARLRHYRAGIEYRQSMNDYVVTLAGSFLSGLICTAGAGRLAGIGCHQFFAFEDIGSMWFELRNNNDDAHGGHLVEQLSDGTWMEVIGMAAGPLTALSGFEATGRANVWYCPTPSAYPFPCSGPRSCAATDMRLTLTRSN